MENMKSGAHLESTIIREFDALRQAGVLRVGLILSEPARRAITAHLAESNRLAATIPQKRSRLALMPHFILEEYSEPGYRVGDLGEISNEWRFRRQATLMSSQE